MERLAERAELEPARLAHARYFADLTNRLEPALRSARQLDAMHILDVERENILAALRFSVTRVARSRPWRWRWP